MLKPQSGILFLGPLTIVVHGFSGALSFVGSNRVRFTQRLSYEIDRR